MKVFLVKRLKPSVIWWMINAAITAWLLMTQNTTANHPTLPGGQIRHVSSDPADSTNGRNLRQAGPAGSAPRTAAHGIGREAFDSALLRYCVDEDLTLSDLAFRRFPVDGPVAREIGAALSRVKSAVEAEEKKNMSKVKDEEGNEMLVVGSSGKEVQELLNPILDELAGKLKGTDMAAAREMIEKCSRFANWHGRTELYFDPVGEDQFNFVVVDVHADGSSKKTSFTFGIDDVAGIGRFSHLIDPTPWSNYLKAAAARKGMAVERK